MMLICTSQIIHDVNVNVPIDVDVTSIIPINTEIENAQICVNLGGTPTCQINNINRLPISIVQQLSF
jgi:hypothetical protein